jgi:Tfp pilus assembly protein PilF
MSSTLKNIDKVQRSAKVSALLIAFAVSGYCGSAEAQMPMSPAAQVTQIHDDLLQDYQRLGKNVEMEGEYKWLLANKPTNAVYHYNYACFLKAAGRNGPALAEFKKAAQYDGSNVDFVGAAGQVMLGAKDYNGAYQYLYRACSMPGGDKFKASLDNAIKYKQYADQQAQIRAQQKAAPAAKSGAAGAKKSSDDDDD